MRSLNIIDTERDLLRNTINNYEAERIKAIYKKPTGGIKPAIISIITAPIAGLIAGAYCHDYQDRGFQTGGLMILIPALAVFILSLVYASRFIKERASSAALMTFFIISTLIFAISLVGFLYTLSDQSLIITLFPSEKEELDTEAAYNMFIKDVMVMDCVIMLPSFVLMIGSLAGFISEQRKKHTSVRVRADLQTKKDYANNTLNVLNNEYTSTKEELDRQFQSEIKKAEPDMVKLKSIADLGLTEADTWITVKEKNDRLAEGKRIFITEMQKDKPDIDELKRSASLGDPDANLYLAKISAVECFANLEDYPNYEICGIFKNVFNYVNNAADCQDCQTRDMLKTLSKVIVFALDQDLSKIPTQDEVKQLIISLRELKRRSDLSVEEKKFAERAFDYSKNALDILEESEREAKERERKQRREEQESSYSYYVPERRLTESEMRDYFYNEMHGFWNPTKIMNDSRLTEAEKEQLLDYTRSGD